METQRKCSVESLWIFLKIVHDCCPTDWKPKRTRKTQKKTNNKRKLWSVICWKKQKISNSSPQRAPKVYKSCLRVLQFNNCLCGRFWLQIKGFLVPKLSIKTIQKIIILLNHQNLLTIIHSTPIWKLSKTSKKKILTQRKTLDPLSYHLATTSVIQTLMKMSSEICNLTNRKGTTLLLFVFPMIENTWWENVQTVLLTLKKLKILLNRTRNFRPFFRLRMKRSKNWL